MPNVTHLATQANTPLHKGLSDKLINNFHHINFFTGSANATKDLFINKFNFTLTSFSGPETGNKETLNYLLLNGNAKIMISSPLGNNTHTQRLMNNFLSNHGDGIGDVAFVTNDIHGLRKNMNEKNGIITNDLEYYDNYNESSKLQLNKENLGVLNSNLNDLIFDILGYKKVS